MNKKSICAWLLITFCLTLLGGELLSVMAQVGTTPNIAVIPFNDASAAAKKEGYGEAVANMLTTELIKGKVFQVVERNQIQRMLQELSLQSTGAIDAQTAKQMGAILGVDILILGSVVKLESVVETDIRLINSQTGEALLAESGHSENPRELRDMVIQLARKIEQRYSNRFNNETAFTSEPTAATVYVDGQIIGETPISKTISPGEHEIQIAKEGFRLWEKKVQIKSGPNQIFAQLNVPATQTTPAVEPPKPPTIPKTPIQTPRPASGGSSKTLWWAIGGAAVVGGVVAIVVSQSKEDDKSTKKGSIKIIW
ncbi:PEGA domain-containing protein [candidate division KSB1 bacterium]|nr:PEGA domain-containing protein [candidate division KSB1 bacterium]